ncbi:MAG: OmpH family outer membrane protein [Odoribacteraceae bacterium]|jgi:outer membrane protein|nr:OmpH family outer membrane protein [Odoribacteraceae bacterium]
MKNVSLGVNVLLFIAVIVLYVLHFTGKATPESADAGARVDRGDARIVYLNMDSLLTNYAQSKELNEAFLKKMETNRTDLNQKVKAWTQAGEEFQRKIDNNGFATRERADQEYKDLMLRKERLEQMEQEMRETMQREQMELNQKLYNAIIAFLTDYNKEKEYNLILSTTLGGNVFYAEPGFDITREVVERLNARYAGK